MVRLGLFDDYPSFLFFLYEIKRGIDEELEETEGLEV